MESARALHGRAAITLARHRDSFSTSSLRSLATHPNLPPVTQFGGREVILSQSILVADNEEAQIDTNLAGNPLKLTLKFVTNPEGKPQVHWTGEPQQATLHFTIYNWVSPLGSSLFEPIRLGETPDGRSFGFQLVHFRIGKLNRADFYLLLGGQYGKPDAT